MRKRYVFPPAALTCLYAGCKRFFTSYLNDFEGYCSNDCRHRDTHPADRQVQGRKDMSKRHYVGYATIDALQDGPRLDAALDRLKYDWATGGVAAVCAEVTPLASPEIDAAEVYPLPGDWVAEFEEFTVVWNFVNRYIEINQRVTIEDD